MAKQIDVYRDWLGVQEAARPLNHYQLLRLKPFEDDASTIRSHYRKMNAHVRKFAAGDFAVQSQKLLNELAAAMLCLTDAQRKREYDATLGRAGGGGLQQRSFEEILLANRVIDQAQLAKARNYAKAVGLEVRDAVVQQKMAPADVVTLAYAEAIGLPYVELEDIGVAEAIVPLIPPNTARQHSFIPVMADDAQVLVASPNPLVPDIEEELRLRLGRQIRSVLCTPASINQYIAKYYPAGAVVAAPVAAASPGQAAASAKPKKVKEPLTADEVTKLKRNSALLGMAVTYIVMFFLLYFLRGGMYKMGFRELFISFVVSLVGAAIGFFLGPKLAS